MTSTFGWLRADLCASCDGWNASGALVTACLYGAMTMGTGGGCGSGQAGRRIYGST